MVYFLLFYIKTLDFKGTDSLFNHFKSRHYADLSASQYCCIARKTADAVQAINTSPVSTSMEVKSRRASVGVTSPNPTAVTESHRCICNSRVVEVVRESGLIGPVELPMSARGDKDAQSNGKQAYLQQMGDDGHQDQ
jgi:hypothetical protein